MLTANHALVDGLHLAASLTAWRSAPPIRRSIFEEKLSLTLFDTVPANQAAYAVALAPHGVSLRPRTSP
ncbi:MAG: hypothetical protein ACLTG4_11125 [Oscillospiraceae bacterium]